ncbi:hypothetical protein ABB02_00226 [Clostridiaceae bacterium JG1575]|nr:hypothetical protein ABB02_00226 [Clostridiaceae bacterium JG1575]
MIIQKSTEWIPLKLQGNIPLVDAQIGDKSVCFILDSGANSTILNATYYQHTQDYDGKIPEGSTGSISIQGNITIPSLSCLGLEATDYDAMVMPLNHLEQSLGCRIDGLIGFTFIQDYALELDYANQRVRLLTKEQIPSVASGMKLIPLDRHKHLGITSSRVHGSLFRWILDTGASRNMVDSSWSTHLPKEWINLPEEELIGASPTDAPVVPRGTMGSIEMMDFVTDNPVFNVNDMGFLIASMDALNKDLEKPCQGIMGFELFKQGRCIIDLDEKVFYWQAYDSMTAS